MNEIFNINTGLWEPVELDKFGFAILEANDDQNTNKDSFEKLSIIKNETNCQDLAKNIPMPKKSIMAVFDCEAMQWVVNEEISIKKYFSSVVQEWPSWIQESDGLWYAPKDPPDDGFVYVWDEIAQDWHLLAPVQVDPPDQTPEDAVPYVK